MPPLPHVKLANLPPASHPPRPSLSLRLAGPVWPLDRPLAEDGQRFTGHKVACLMLSSPEGGRAGPVIAAQDAQGCDAMRRADRPEGCTRGPSGRTRPIMRIRRPKQTSPGALCFRGGGGTAAAAWGECSPVPQVRRHRQRCHRRSQPRESPDRKTSTTGGSPEGEGKGKKGRHRESPRGGGWQWRRGRGAGVRRMGEIVK